MKRFLVAILGILLIVSLCSCSSTDTGTSSIYTVNKYETEYIVDPNNGTISDGTYTYQYEISESSRGYTINITYPDGSTYWWSAQRSGNVTTGSGGWSDDYVENRYADGRTLCDILEENKPREKGSENVLFVLLLIVIGIFNTVWPRAAWYLEYGWRYKNAEPSNLALGLNRFGGITVIIIAIIMVFT